MKKQYDLSRLMGYAGNYRYFTYTSWVLSYLIYIAALLCSCSCLTGGWGC